MTLLFFSISGGEIFLVLLFVLVFFGADKIPGLARTMGRTIRQIRDATGDIQREIGDSARDFKDQANRFRDEVEDRNRDKKDSGGSTPKDQDPS